MNTTIIFNHALVEAGTNANAVVSTANLLFIKCANDPVNVYAVTLPAHDSKFTNYPNMPIEYLYDRNILDSLGIKLKKMPFKKAVGCCNYDKDENTFNTDDSLWTYELCDDNDKKDYRKR